MLLIKKKSTSKIYLIKHERSYVNVFNACAQTTTTTTTTTRHASVLQNFENLQRSVGVVVVVVERTHCTHVAK